MLDVLKKCFPARMETNEWQSKLKQMIPSYGQSLAKDAELCRKTRKQTAEILGLVYRMENL
jgi:malate dehydrogenase (quinone)